MLPDPLHPAVVHLPLGLAVLSPAAALLVALAIRRSAIPPRAWAAIVLLQATMLGSAWFASEMGEREEDRVEKVVAERHIEEHEELAERLLIASGLALALAAVGLLPGAPGGIGRGATVVATLVVLAAGVQTGHSGGELVYRHGAANAYLDEGHGNAGGPQAGLEHAEDD